MTSGIMNGTLIGLYVNGSVKVANAVSNDMDITQATRETTNKDSAGWKTALGSTKSFSMGIEGMYSENATYSASDLITLLIAGTPITAYMTSAVTGDHKWSGSVNITNIKVTAPFEGNVTFTATLEGTGALTPTTV